MRQARSLLEKAQTQSAGDATAAARVDWLAKGLRQAELLLGVERGYERAVDTGDKTEFLTAYQSLKAFRAANADYDKTNFAGLAGDEQKWERKLSE